MGYGLWLRAPQRAWRALALAAPPELIPPRPAPPVPYAICGEQKRRTKGRRCNIFRKEKINGRFFLVYDL
eukprot:scaffold170204_cov21-Tisochrysis_lutea.AAC.1